MRLSAERYVIGCGKDNAVALAPEQIEILGG